MNDPTRQQRQAMRRIERWYGGDDNTLYRLFGYAGTGKTTLVRLIADRLGLVVVYAAYTGKAAHVMRTKGCTGARTLHSLIYLPVDVIREGLAEMRSALDAETDPRERRKLVAEIRKAEAEVSQPGWVRNEDSELVGADLLIIDEVSMVNRDMAEDILSFGAPVLVLGDPAQLPPPDNDGDGYFIKAKPDYMLTEVHRHAADSPVIDLATGIRSGKRPSAQRVGRCTMYLPVSARKVATAGQVIVGTNRSRWRQIHQLRDLQGLDQAMPMPGDKVICLTNNRALDLFNGQMFDVLGVQHPDDSTVRLKLRTADGDVRRVPVWSAGFLGQEAEDRFRPLSYRRPECAFMTFGQAITCHKAQGSQWSSVVIVDESAVFREMGTRWLYTAVTRAEKRVHIVRTGQQRWS